MGIIFLPLMFLALWAIVILPQQRRMKAHRALVSVLEVGNEVMTTSGLYGFITGFDGDIVWLEIDDNIQVRIARAAIQRKIIASAPSNGKGDAPADVTEEDKSDK